MWAALQDAGREDNTSWSLQELTERYGPLHPCIARLRAQPVFRQKSSEWLQQRAGMLTASDVPAVCGQNVYSSRKTCFRSKVGLTEPFTGSPATRWGEHFEDFAAAEYERRHQCHIVNFGLLTHAEHPWLGASVDGIVSDSGVIVEIKCPASTRPIDSVPPHYVGQAQVQMEVCDLELCDFVQYRPAIPGVQPMQYSETRLHRDRQWFAENFEKMRSFQADVEEYRRTGELPDEYQVRPRRPASASPKAPLPPPAEHLVQDEEHMHERTRHADGQHEEWHQKPRQRWNMNWMMVAQNAILQ